MGGRRHDAVVGRETLQRVRGRRGQEHRCEVCGVEALRVGREAVPLEKGEIEVDVMPDEDRIAGEGSETRDRGFDGGRVAEVRIADPGQPRDRRPDVAAWIDERTEALARIGALGREPDAYGADLDDPIRLRIEPRRFQVDRDELLHQVADLGRPGSAGAARHYGYDVPRSFVRR